MNRLTPHLLLGAATLVLSFASFIVVMMGASEEPYVKFHGEDAFIQIGVATTLMTLWALLAVGTFYGVIRNRLSPAWLMLFVWIVICELYLSCCPRGYIEDITRYIAHPY